MKRVFILMLLFFATAAFAEDSLETLLNTWLKAIGGKDKVAAIRTFSIRSKVETSGLKGFAEEWGDTSGNHRTDLNLSDVYQTTTVYNSDAKKGWILDQNKKSQQLEGTDLELEVTGAYLASFAPFFTGRMTGRVSAAGPNALKIEPAGGKPITVYFDLKTGLPQRMEQQEQDRIRATYFSDWRPQDGVLVPYSQRQTTGEPKFDVMIAVQEVRWNPTVEESMFSKPEEAAPDYHFAAGDSAAGIPFELNSNHVFVQVSVNGSAPLWFLLDTGAETSTINLRKAREMGFELKGKMEARGAGEKSAEVSFVKDASFQIPGVELQHQLVAAFDLTALEGYEGHPIDGILGYDFISRFVVEIDYAGRKLSLHEPKTFAYSGKGQTIPILLQGNLPTIRARLNAGAEIEGKYDIDTGNRTCLVLNRPFHEKHGLAKSTSTIEALWGMGVGGQGKSKIGRIGEFLIGSYKLKDVLTSFSADTKGAFADPEMAGNIGGEILRRFIVILNYSQKVMILEPNKDFNEPFRFDMSGLNLTSTRPAFSEVRVNSVIAGSPAALSGIVEGDTIAQVDGKPVTGLMLEELRQSLKQDGSRKKIRLSRGGKTMDVELVLKPLI